MILCFRYADVLYTKLEALYRFRWARRSLLMTLTFKK